MIPADHELFDMMRQLQRTLSHRTVLLRHAHSDVDVYAEGLRDLGNDLTDIGRHCLDRVAELDTQPVDSTKRQSAHIVTLSGLLNDLALEHCRVINTAGE